MKWTTLTGLSLLGVGAALAWSERAKRWEASRAPLERVGIFGGMAAVGFGAIHLASKADASEAVAAAVPSSAPSLPAPPLVPPSAAAVHMIDDKSLSLAPGVPYAAAVTLGFALSLLATAAKVQAYAQKLGFANVAVFEDHPPGWFGPLPKADYFVFGTWAKEPQSMDRPDEVVDAWHG